MLMMMMMIAMVCLPSKKIAEVFCPKCCGIQLESELTFCVFLNIL